MQTRQFRIGELAKKLNVEPFVIRFWEKEFNIKPHRSNGQQRFYSEKDLVKFELIKDLLYQQGMTIAGAKKQLFCKPQVISATKTIIQEENSSLPQEVKVKLTDLRKHLTQFRDLLS
jgi:DNA-binding transcriptional MerR regulator